MKFFQSLTPALLLLAAGVAQAASSWTFDEGKVVVAAKRGADGVKETLNDKTPLSKTLSLGYSDSLKVSFTAKEGGKAKRPHQAFLLLKEAESGLEAPFPLTLKDNGKGIVEVTQKDLPVQLLVSTKPLQASIVIGSFGAAVGLNTKLFDIEVKLDSNHPIPAYEKPLRYGKQPEIHHTFRADPKNPPKVVSLFFVLAVLATLPVLGLGWLALGANVDHFQQAFSAAPVSHATFLGGIVAMEYVFFMYYSTWNLFTALPVIGLVGAVTFLSGTKALGEVQNRRLAGVR